ELLRQLAERELGQDLAQRRQMLSLELRSRQRTAKRCRERHVAKVPLQLRAARAPDPNVNEARGQLIKEPRLPEPRLPLDHQQGKRTVERLPHAAFERVELARPAEQAEDGMLAGVLRPPDRAWQERADVLLAEDGRLERPRLGGRLETELLVQPRAKSTVGLERVVLAPERIETKHRRAVGALAEAIE